MVAGRGGGQRHSVLKDSDLGMLMLLVHQCQQVLWGEKRRFLPAEVKSAHEDLIELSGERGFVSVRQQRSIIERMHRSYVFLKSEVNHNVVDF